MIHIFFVPGMFGSTLEYVLRSFTLEYTPVQTSIQFDGSMHGYKKEQHPGSINEVPTIFEGSRSSSIFTPIYPFSDAHLTDILTAYIPFTSASDTLIQIYAPDLRAAELNMLFQYRKVATGTGDMSLDIFCNPGTGITNWNQSYKTWRDMQPWELREWISIFYAEWVQEWIGTDSALHHVSNLDLLFNTAPTWQSIIAHCGLTATPGLADFAVTWGEHQQYIINEFNLIDAIVAATVANNMLTWDTQSFSIISEAIVQNRLRNLGYEIKCYNLNKFPNNSKTLYSLLDKC